MKRSVALFLALVLITGLFPLSASFAESKSNKVTVNGQTRTLHWDNIFGKDNKLEIRIKGFKKKDKGKDFGNAGVLSDGKEIKADKSKDDGKGKCTYYFKKAGWPQAIFFYPKDGSNRRLVLWKDEGVTIVGKKFVGEWEGYAAAKKGGDEYTLEVSLDEDGNGILKFEGEDSSAMLPFTALMDGKKFTGKIVGNIKPITKISGTLKLSGDKMTSDITVTTKAGDKVKYKLTLTPQTEEEEDDEDDDGDEDDADGGSGEDLTPDSTDAGTDGNPDSVQENTPGDGTARI